MSIHIRIAIMLFALVTLSSCMPPREDILNENTELFNAIQNKSPVPSLQDMTTEPHVMMAPGLQHVGFMIFGMENEDDRAAIQSFLKKEAKASGITRKIVVEYHMSGGEGKPDSMTDIVTVQK